MNIVMLVRNPLDRDITYDARVMKEAKALAEHKHLITIIAIKSSQDPDPNEQLHNISIIRLEVASDKLRCRKNNFLKKVKTYNCFKKLATKLLPEIKPEILHCHDLDTLVIGVHYKRKHQCTLIYDAHEIFSETASATRRVALKYYYHYLQKKLSKAVDIFITINKSIADHYSSRYQALPTPYIITNASELSAPTTPYDGRLHKLANIDAQKRIILYQGDLSPYRGLMHLVAAAPLLDECWHLVILGSGSYQNQLEKIAHDDLDRVSFIPMATRSDLMSLTQGATLGVIPYLDNCLNYKYVTPNKLWEYPLANVPILASPLVELSAYIQAYEIGWLLPKESQATTIAATINQLTDLSIAKKKNNCDKFIKENSWQAEKEKLNLIYSKNNLISCHLNPNV